MKYDALIFDLDGTLWDSSASNVYPGVVEGIRELRAKYPLYIVSNCQEKTIEKCLELTGLTGAFLDWECLGATGLSKGENMKELTKRHKLKNAAYIGDSSGDQEAAIYAGATYYHVDYGHGQPTKRCTHFDTFSEVVAYFLKA